MSILRFNEGRIYIKLAAGEIEATEDELIALTEMWVLSAASKDLAGVDRCRDVQTTPPYFDDEGLTLYPELETDCD